MASVFNRIFNCRKKICKKKVSEVVYNSDSGV